MERPADADRTKSFTADSPQSPFRQKESLTRRERTRVERRVDVKSLVGLGHTPLQLRGTSSARPDRMLPLRRPCINAVRARIHAYPPLAVPILLATLLGRKGAMRRPCQIRHKVAN